MFGSVRSKSEGISIFRTVCFRAGRAATHQEKVKRYYSDQNQPTVLHWQIQDKECMVSVFRFSPLVQKNGYSSVQWVQTNPSGTNLTHNAWPFMLCG